MDAHAGKPLKGIRRAAAQVVSVGIGALCLALTVSSAAPPAAQAADASGHVRWGAFGASRAGEDKQQAIQRLETLAGRKLDTVRDFLLWDSPFPTSFETWAVAGGRTLMVSVKTTRLNGQKVMWRDLAAAQPGSALDSQMVAWAQKIKALGVPVYVTLNHEPEAAASSSMGTDAEFKAAWQKWVGVFRAQDVTNARFNWIMTDYSFQVPSSDRRYAPKWYPGDAYVDSIAADAYNWLTCRPGITNAWKPLAQIIEQQRQFGLAHPDKELWLAEYGSVEDPASPNRKAQWFTDAQALFKQPAYAQYVGVNLFESTGSTCRWQADSSPAAAAGWKAWGADPFYNGAGTPPPPPPPPPSDKRALLVVGNPAALGTDATVQARVAGLGFTVTVIDDNVVTAAAASGYDLVLVSQTTATAAVNTKLRGAAVPLVVWKPYLFDDFALTAPGAVGAGGATSVTITNPAHPLAAGLAGTVAITSSTANVGWGTTLPAAQVAATVPGGSAVFAYAPGAALAGGLSAPACRVGLPFSSDSMTRMTAAGWALFDNAITWSVTGCA